MICQAGRGDKLNLRQLRHDRGLTMKQVAEMAGCSEAAVSLYERDKRKPTLITAYRIAKALNVSIDDLFKKAG